MFRVFVSIFHRVRLSHSHPSPCLRVVQCAMCAHFKLYPFLFWMIWFFFASLYPLVVLLNYNLYSFASDSRIRYGCVSEWAQTERAPVLSIANENRLHCMRQNFSIRSILLSAVFSASIFLGAVEKLFTLFFMCVAAESTACNSFFGSSVLR